MFSQELFKKFPISIKVEISYDGCDPRLRDYNKKAAEGPTQNFKKQILQLKIDTIASEIRLLQYDLQILIQDLYQNEAGKFLTEADDWHPNKSKNFQHYCIRNLALQVSRKTAQLAKQYQTKTLEKAEKQRKRELEGEIEENNLNKKSVKELIDLANEDLVNDHTRLKQEISELKSMNKALLNLQTHNKALIVSPTQEARKNHPPSHRRYKSNSRNLSSRNNKSSNSGPLQPSQRYNKSSNSGPFQPNQRYNKNSNSRPFQPNQRYNRNSEPFQPNQRRVHMREEERHWIPN